MNVTAEAARGRAESPGHSPAASPAGCCVCPPRAHTRASCGHLTPPSSCIHLTHTWQRARSFLYMKVISQGFGELAGPSPATSRGKQHTYFCVWEKSWHSPSCRQVVGLNVRGVYCCKTLPLRTGSPGGDRRSCCCCCCCRRVVVVQEGGCSSRGRCSSTARCHLTGRWTWARCVTAPGACLSAARRRAER